MRFHVDQTAGARNRRVIRRVLIQPYPHKAPQPQRIRQLPGNPPFTVDALEVTQQQRPEVDPRGQRRPAILSRIELRTPSLYKLVELLRLQQFIESLIERMSWRRRQLRMSDPNVFLLFPLLARSHCHTRILRILPVDTSNFFAYASGLTPRAAKGVRRFQAQAEKQLPPPPLRSASQCQQLSAVDRVAASSRQAVTIFGDQLFTNAPMRSSALEKLSPASAKPRRKCEGAAKQSPGASRIPRSVAAWQNGRSFSPLTSQGNAVMPPCRVIQPHTSPSSAMKRSN